MRRLLYYFCLVVAVVLMASAGGMAVFAEGIDSEGDELPMHANQTLVATLRNTAAGGLLDVANGVRIGKVGNDSDTDCVGGQAGIIRYNSTSGSMQYCNGQTKKWSAAFSGGSDNGSFGVSCAGVYNTPTVYVNNKHVPCQTYMNIYVSYEADNTYCVVGKYDYQSYGIYYCPEVGTKRPATCIPNPKTGKCNCPEGSTKTIMGGDGTYQYWLCQNLSD